MKNVYTKCRGVSGETALDNLPHWEKSKLFSLKLFWFLILIILGTEVYDKDFLIDLKLGEHELPAMLYPSMLLFLLTPLKEEIWYNIQP